MSIDSLSVPLLKGDSYVVKEVLEGETVQISFFVSQVARQYISVGQIFALDVNSKEICGIITNVSSTPLDNGLLEICGRVEELQEESDFSLSERKVLCLEAVVYEGQEVTLYCYNQKIEVKESVI